MNDYFYEGILSDAQDDVDYSDWYHLWVLPKDYQLPFGIHPTRDPQGTPVQRGYDYNMKDVMAWNNSPERQAVYIK